MVVDTDQPMTITGSSNMSILGGTGQITVIDPGAVALADTNTVTSGANSTVNLMSTDDGAVVAGNNGNDILAAFGANQSIGGGTGSNNMFALGSGDTISAIGSHDTLSGGSSAATFMNSGSNALMFAAVGGGAIFDTGEQIKNCRIERNFGCHDRRRPWGVVRRRWRYVRDGFPEQLPRSLVAAVQQPLPLPAAASCSANNPAT